MLNKGDIFKEINRVREVVKNAPQIAGAEGELFFKEGFNRQAWQGDNGNEPWEKRKHNTDPGRNILVRRANLMKGLRKFVNGNYVAVKVTGAATRYADAHNFGLKVTIRVTPQMRKWAWAMFYRTGIEMYKGMALTKKTVISFKMPQRKFIGPTKQLDKRISDLLEKQLTST